MAQQDGVQLQFPIGDRGYLVTAFTNRVEIRQHHRSYKDYNRLIESPKVVVVNTNEWQDLCDSMEAVENTIAKYNEGDQNVCIVRSLGQNGLHLAVNTFQDRLLIHIRIYYRSFSDPTKIFPSKKGVALTVPEWQSITDKTTSICEAFL